MDDETRGPLTPTECATLLGLAPKTLSNYRHLPGPYVGPPYLRVGRGRGRIRYPRGEALSWLRAQCGTSDDSGVL